MLFLNAANLSFKCVLNVNSRADGTGNHINIDIQFSIKMLIVIYLSVHIFIYLIMAVNLDIGNHLNEQQVMMLRLLKNPLPEEDFLQVRRLAVKLLSKQLDELTEDWEHKNDIKPEDYENLSKGHFRSKP